MIQANELRIGSFVVYKWFDKNYSSALGAPKQRTIINREIVKILAVDGENKRVLVKTNQRRKNQTWISLSKTTPIPLTEEILLKCGFEILDDGKVKHDSLSDFETNFIFNSKSDIIKYLHQLQNLYFSLTQEELCVDI